MSKQATIFDDPLYAGAEISICGKYRYLLWRNWHLNKPKILFIGLNPSTADEKLNDPTTRRLVEFAHGFGYGGMYLINLFAFRATLPKFLYEEKHPVTAPNMKVHEADEWLKVAGTICDKAVFCWGNVKETPESLARIEFMKTAFTDPFCFGKTNEGHPKHPLYLLKTTQLEPFNRKILTLND